MNILRGDFLGNHVIFLKSAQNLATKLFSEWVIFPGTQYRSGQIFRCELLAGKANKREKIEKTKRCG